MQGRCRRINGPRVDLSWTVCVFDLEGTVRGLCKTMNMSEKGARLTMSETFDIPDAFSLSFSRNSKVSRHCNVIWRNENDLGIRFVNAPEAAPTPAPFLV